VGDPLARFARVSPSRGGRAAEGGRGSLTRHLEWLTNALECTECLLEIGDEVFDVFDSYGETHKPVRNT
jgi:hypothetical protein